MEVSAKPLTVAVLPQPVISERRQGKHYSGGTVGRCTAGQTETKRRPSGTFACRGLTATPPLPQKGR